jgi:hypothetical protein
MRVEDLKTFAINTAKFYAQHCDMAEQIASHRIWALHVRVNVLPLYRREFHEPYEGMTVAELDEVATELQHYYSQHIGERDA